MGCTSLPAAVITYLRLGGLSINSKNGNARSEAGNCGSFEARAGTGRDAWPYIDAPCGDKKYFYDI